MTQIIKIDREKSQFVTDVSIVNFAKLFPGQAEESEKKAGSKYYKCEIYSKTLSKSMIDAFSYIAQIYAPNNWQDHVNAQFKTLEQMCTPVPGQPVPKRQYDKYPYAVGHYVMNFSKSVSLKMLKMEQANLSDPAVRAEYDLKVNQAAPKITRYANINDPADIARIEQLSRDNMLRGVPPIAQADYARVMLPVTSSELWNGCKVRVFGRVYWDEKIHKTCLPALEQIMLVGPGERISGGYEARPEDVFGAFAPAENLAPDPYAGVV